MTPRADHGETSYVGNGRLHDRKALVTGGDSGIGRATAIAFAREGADVAINYLPSEESDAQEVIALIKAEGRQAFALPGDLSDEKFARKLVQDAHKHLGGLDILAAVAGKQHFVEKIADVTTEQFEATYRVNVTALFWICQTALPPHAAWRVDHHNGLYPGDASQPRPARLCSDQSCNPGVHIARWPGRSLEMVFE